MLREIKLYYITLYYITLYYIILYYVYYIILYYIIKYYIILYYIISYHIISYYITLYYIIPYDTVKHHMHMTIYKITGALNIVCIIWILFLLVNNFELSCKDFMGGTDSEGEWSSVNKCPDEYYVCGVKPRVEDPKGRSVADTSITELEFFCCSARNLKW